MVGEHAERAEPERGDLGQVAAVRGNGEQVHRDLLVLLEEAVEGDVAVLAGERRPSGGGDGQGDERCGERVPALEPHGDLLVDSR